MSRSQTTKDRLIQAAAPIFAEKGYRDTTVAEICDAAEANIAAVNYHFGDKESLYDAVWRHAFEVTAHEFPLHGKLPDEPTLEDYLYSYAHALMSRIFNEGEAGLFPKLLHQEMSNPTLALDRIGQEVLFPQSQFVGKEIRSFLETDLSEDEIRFCVHSVVGQCAFYNFSRPLRERLIGNKPMSNEEIERLARHIARFSIGGLKEAKKG